MSSLTTLARPYAKAAFEIAREQGRLPQWGAALDAASNAVAVPEMAEWLASPELDAARAIDLIAETAGDAADESFRRFLAVLADNGRLALLPEITGLFARLRQDAENRLEVRVVSAVALDDDQAERMSAALAKRFERTIALHNEVDAGLLGGAVIYAGDEVIDGSVLGRLKRLQGSLA